MTTKLGRNDTCHCGSTKKYKKCCLDADLLEKQILNTYTESEDMTLSLTILRDLFPQIEFVNVSDKLNRQSYRTLQINKFKTNVCQVAEKIERNAGVFKDRDNSDNEYDLLLMFNGAYRIIHLGNSIFTYSASLKSFFENPHGSPVTK